MTYIEKAVQEEEKAGSGVTKEMIIKGSCPSAYGLLNEGDCENKKCVECWNREMPNTNKSVLLTMNKETELNIDKKIKEQEENSYNQGLNDAWELAKDIVLIPENGGIGTEELKKIFNTLLCSEVLMNFTPQEALAKLKEYEESKIEVGDVVEHPEAQTVGVVTKVYDEKKAYICFRDGSCSLYEMRAFKKTGKHIDISSILEQIGG